MLNHFNQSLKDNSFSDVTIIKITDNKICLELYSNNDIKYIVDCDVIIKNNLIQSFERIHILKNNGRYNTNESVDYHFSLFKAFIVILHSQNIIDRIY